MYSIWFRPAGPWVNEKLYIRKETDNKIRCSLLLLERNSSWRPSKVDFRAITVQYFLMRFIFATYFASYTNGNTSCTEHDSIDQVITRSEKTAESFFKWFTDNQMKANPTYLPIRLDIYGYPQQFVFNGFCCPSHLEGVLLLFQCLFLVCQCIWFMVFLCFFLHI